FARLSARNPRPELPRAARIRIQGEAALRRLPVAARDGLFGAGHRLFDPPPAQFRLDAFPQSPQRAVVGEPAGQFVQPLRRGLSGISQDSALMAWRTEAASLATSDWRLAAIASSRSASRPDCRP